MFHILDVKILPEDLLIMISDLFFLPDRCSEDSQCATAAKLLRCLRGENIHLYTFDVALQLNLPSARPDEPNQSMIYIYDPLLLM